MSDYATMLDSKRIKSLGAGLSVDESAINPILFPFQRAIARWACRSGRAIGERADAILDGGSMNQLTERTVALLRTTQVAYKRRYYQLATLHGEIDCLIELMLLGEDVTEYLLW